MKQLFIIVVLFVFTDSLPAQCDAFFGADYSGGKVFIIKDNRIVWEHPALESNDIWVLPSGNLLFSTGKGVLEVTLQHDTVFHYASQSAVYACQRLKNGNTFVGECNTGRMLEITPSGKIVKDVCILPEGVTDGGSAFMRNARRLDNGNYLVAHYGGEAVKEYNPGGKVVWNVKVPGGPHSVIRLPNGNTLVAVADKNHNPRIMELTPQGECVWEISNKDIPGEPLKFIGGMYYTPDSKLVFTNWVGHENPRQSTHLFCVTKDKHVVCALGNCEGITTMSSVYPLEKRNKRIYH